MNPLSFHDRRYCEDATEIDIGVTHTEFSNAYRRENAVAIRNEHPELPAILIGHIDRYEARVSRLQDHLKTIPIVRSTKSCTPPSST